MNEWQRLPMSNLGDTFLAYADELEMDQTNFVNCLQSEEIAQEVQSDYLDGVKYGTTGTPAFFVGTEKDGFVRISGAQPYSTFAQIIESLS